MDIVKFYELVELAEKVRNTYNKVSELSDGIVELDTLRPFLEELECRHESLLWDIQEKFKEIHKELYANYEKCDGCKLWERYGDDADSFVVKSDNQKYQIMTQKDHSHTAIIRYVEFGDGHENDIEYYGLSVQYEVDGE